MILFWFSYALYFLFIHSLVLSHLNIYIYYTVIVRKLPSVETLGCTSVICTDKTGTLTTNEMTAVSLVLFEADQHQPVVEHNIIGSSYSPVGYVEGIRPGEEIKSLPRGAVADIAAVSALCNDAKIVGHDDHSEDEKDFERIGEPTEGA